MKCLVVLLVLAVAAIHAKLERQVITVNDDALGEFISETGETDIAEEQGDEVTTAATPSRRGHEHRRGHWHRGGGKWSDEQKLNFMCQSIQSSSDGEMKWKRFSHKMDRMSEEEREKVKEYWTTTKAAMKKCCELTGTERQQCAETLKKQKYDRICSGEQKHSMWLSMKGKQHSEQMTAKKDNCCSKTGEERYTCFAELHHHGHHGGRGRFMKPVVPASRSFKQWPMTKN